MGSQRASLALPSKEGWVPGQLWSSAPQEAPSTARALTRTTPYIRMRSGGSRRGSQSAKIQATEDGWAVDIDRWVDGWTSEGRWCKIQVQQQTRQPRFPETEPYQD